MTTTATELAEAIVWYADELGFRLLVKRGLVTVTTTFTPGDDAEYARCENEAATILEMCPQTSPGSVWGTDGLSVGGAVALKTGSFRMNKSGVSVRLTNALLKAGAERLR